MGHPRVWVKVQCLLVSLAARRGQQCWGINMTFRHWLRVRGGQSKFFRSRLRRLKQIFSAEPAPGGGFFQDPVRGCTRRHLTLCDCHRATRRIYISAIARNRRGPAAPSGQSARFNPKQRTDGSPLDQAGFLRGWRPVKPFFVATARTRSGFPGCGAV